MVYIIAGPDGSGKTTIANRLRAEHSDVTVIKESYTNSTTEKYDRVRKVKYLSRLDQVVVYDRATLLDDIIYSPIMNNKPSEITELEGAIELLKQCTIIYLDCDTETLQSRVEQRGDEYIKPEHIPMIQDRYSTFFSTNEIEVYTVDASLPEEWVYEDVCNIINKKKFRMAHIVPVNSLGKTFDCGYHMCLANIVIKSEEYASYYADVASDKKHWVLMDNGAAEGDQLSLDDLVKCYDIVKPNEVVLPDTLCDGKDTIRKMHEAIEYLATAYNGNLPFSLMGVPQGRTLEEWYQCAKEMVANRCIKSIGVSKFLQMETGNDSVRYQAVQLINKLAKRYGRYDLEVHLLGCSESPMIIGAIAKAAPIVRGCDSAYAYICTQAGVPIYAMTTRPAGEIDFIDGSDYEGLQANMQSLEIEIGVFNNELDDSWRK